jgi:hypothetical protein
MLKTDANIADFNKVESTVFLTAPATLEVAVGGQAYTCAAGWLVGRDRSIVDGYD